jgi:PAS domain S-box-containing protein
MPAKRLQRDQDQDKKFRLLFEDNPQPMWVLDPESRKFLEVNQAATALYGYTPDEFRGMTLSDAPKHRKLASFGG